MIEYSKRTIEAVATANQTLLGVQLGAACIDARIPVQVVAKWFKVSRQGIYYWFTGVTGVASPREAKVKQVIRVLHKGLDDGALPANDLLTTMRVVKQYREQLK